MQFQTKGLRYGYWVFVAFLKKNIQAILLSFLLSLLGIIALVSFSPYILKFFTTKQITIGISGSFTPDTLPNEVISKFSNGLLYINDKGEMIPLLVDAWEPVDGGREYRFHLKKDLTWNDGTPLKAKDIKFSFKDIKTESPHDYLLVFKLPKPLPIFPTFLTKPITRYPLIGVAGVYRVENIRIRAGMVQEIQLTPNQDDQPRLVYKFYDTDTKLFNAYKLGEITEMTTNKKNVVDQFEKWNNTTIEKNVDYTRIMALFFNLDNPAFKDNKDFRHAIAQSIDNKSFTELGQQAFSPIPPTSWAYEPDTKKFIYSPSISSKIIDKYTESTESAKLRIITYYDQLSLADDIKEDLDSVGLSTQVEVLTGNLPLDFDIFLAQLILSKDPDQYFFWHSTQIAGNITHYTNVRVDKLLEDGRNTFTISNRKALYSDFQKILVDDMPAYFLYHPYIYTIKRK